ncbi:hypothetical protein [Sorangium sp. So ce542]|uniref:hypothetical protein n=1 Tax=Sorangium sp. So ce542 TaxID=3133316 RepID=UPI003F5E551C
MLALADEDQHPALPGLDQPEQVQEGARLDLPVRGRHPAGDAGSLVGDGHIAVAGKAEAQL